MTELFVNTAGNLDINSTAIEIYPLSGLSKLTGLEAILSGEISSLSGYSTPIFLKAAIDTSVLEFKSGKISIKSQGANQIPYFNALGLNSSNLYTYNGSTINGPKFTSNSTVYTDSSLTLTTKSYVEAIFDTTYFTQDSTSHKFKSSLIPVTTSCIVINSSNQLSIGYNTSQFSETSNKLTSTLQPVTSSAIQLSPTN